MARPRQDGLGTCFTDMNTQQQKEVEMPARDFAGKCFGARHTVIQASNTAYGGEPRRRPGDRKEETFFCFTAIGGDDFHVMVELANHSADPVRAKTPAVVGTNLPEISFTMTRGVTNATLTTNYHGTLSGDRINGSYQRSIRTVALDNPTDELGSWTGNNPPPPPILASSLEEDSRGEKTAGEEQDYAEE